MTRDGDLDVKRYTRDQLVRALGRVDREKQPLNFAILSKELASRPSTFGSADAAVKYRSDGRYATEYVVLGGLAGSIAFGIALMLFGSLTRIYGTPIQAAAPGVAFAIVGLSAFWLLLRRRLWGAILATLFYGVQVLSFPILDGKFEFISLPTIQFRIGGDPAAPIQVNIVAVLFLVFSLVVTADYRQRDLSH